MERCLDFRLFFSPMKMDEPGHFESFWDYSILIHIIPSSWEHSYLLFLAWQWALDSILVRPSECAAANSAIHMPAAVYPYASMRKSEETMWPGRKDCAAGVLGSPRRTQRAVRSSETNLLGIRSRHLFLSIEQYRAYAKCHVSWVDLPHEWS